MIVRVCLLLILGVSTITYAASDGDLSPAFQDMKLEKEKLEKRCANAVRMLTLYPSPIWGMLNISMRKASILTSRQIERGVEIIESLCNKGIHPDWCDLTSLSEYVKQFPEKKELLEHWKKQIKEFPTPLYYIACTDQSLLSIAKLLIVLGANIHIRNSNWMPLLVGAFRCENYNPDFITMLLQAGADTGLGYGQLSALARVVQSKEIKDANRLGLFKLLLPYTDISQPAYITPPCKEIEYQGNILHLLARRGRHDEFDALLAQYPDISLDPRDSHGKTPMMIALGCGELGFAQKLEEKGADKLVRPHYENNMFWCAATACKNNAASIEWVLYLFKDNHAKILNHQNIKGETALHGAAELSKKKPEMKEAMKESIATLLAAGANQTIQDNKKRLAFDRVDPRDKDLIALFTPSESK